MVVPKRALKPQWRSAMVSRRWLAQVRRQCQAQAKWRENALASTKFHVFATRIEQRFGKHPLELVSDHAKVSVIHRGLLSWYLKQRAQEEFLMDRHKNPQ